MYRLILRTIINAVSAALIMGVLLGGGLLLRLAWGPVSLDMLAPAITEQVNDRIRSDAPGWAVDVGGAGVRFDRASARLRLLLTDVALRAPGGGVAARAPALGFRIDAWQAVQGDLAVKSVELIGARALLRRTPEGRFRLAMLDIDEAAREVADRRRDDEAARADAAAADEEDRGFAVVAQAVEAFTSERDAPGIVAELDQVVISNLEITYEDAMSGEVWRSREARLTIERGEDGVRARLEGAVETGGDWPPVAIEISGARRRDSDLVDLVADFRDASAGLIASQAPALDMLRRVNAPVEGRLRGRVHLAEGAIEGVSMALSFGAGHLDRGAAPAFPFDQIDLSVALDARREQLSLEQLKVVSDGLEAEAHGSFRLTRAAAEAPGVGRVLGASGRLTLGPARISSPELVVEPITVTGGQARFSYEGDADPESDRGTLRVEDLVVDLAQTRMTGGVEASVYDGALEEARFDIRSNGFPAPDLARLWVSGLAPGAQRWIRENIIGGRITEMTATGQVARAAPGGPLEARALDVAFSFDDLAGTYVEGMTAITEGVGEGRLGLKRFELTVDSATVDLGADGRLALAGSRFEIPDIDADPTPSTVSLKAQGSARALLTLIDQEPLGFVSRLGLDPESVKGAATVDVALSLPLLRDLPLEDVTARAEASLRNLALRPASAGVEVSFAQARLDVDTATLSLSGDARVDGTPLTIEWEETFAPKAGRPRSRVAFSGRLDASALAARGVPVAALDLDGRTRVSGALSMTDGRPPALELSANLDGMGMGVPALGWSKPRDAAGAFRLVGTLPGSGADFTTLSLDTAGLAAKGALALGPEGGLRRLTFNSLKVGRTDVAVTVEPEGENGLDIRARGAALDLAPLLSTAGDADAAGSAGGSTAPFRFAATVSQLHLMSSLAFTDASVDARRTAAGLSAEVKGALSRGAASISLTPEGEDLRFVAKSSNAGDAMRALGFVEDAHGGTIEASGRIEPGGRAVGGIRIKDIVIKNAPVLAEILSIGTVFGAFDKIATGGISFDTVDGDFVVDPERVRILEAAAAGPSLGMSLDGAINRRTGALDLAGSVSPAFVLNGLISGVPLIGDILTGGDGQGIVGFAYRVGGTKDNPSVSVNPLSALTPGPFRRIFTDTDAARRDREAERDAAGAPRVQTPKLDLR